MFLTRNESSSVVTGDNQQSETFGISRAPDIAVGTHFHSQHITKSTLVFLPTFPKALPNESSTLIYFNLAS